MQKIETIDIQSSGDVVLVRQAVRQLAVEIGFGLEPVKKQLLQFII
ncbi:MAG: hypothetical protein V7K69_05440 [Nostoc sp.]